MQESQNNNNPTDARTLMEPLTEADYIVAKLAGTLENTYPDMPTIFSIDENGYKIGSINEQHNGEMWTLWFSPDKSKHFVRTYRPVIETPEEWMARKLRERENDEYN